MLSYAVRKADLLGLLAGAVVVAAVVADEVLLLLLAGAIVALMLGADRPPRRTRSGFDPDVGYPARLTGPHPGVEAVGMDEQREQRQTEQSTTEQSSTEQSSTDTAQVDTGAGDDDVVVVQQGDDLVSFKGGQEVDRRPIGEQKQDPVSDQQREQRDAKPAEPGDGADTATQ